MSVFHCIIPGLPIAWKRAEKDRRSGRTFTNKEQAAHQRMVAAEAMKAWGPVPPLFGPVKLLVIATFPIPASWSKALRAAAERGEVYLDAKPDDDNIRKEIADALNFVAFVDDSQIGDGRCILRYGTGPRTELWLESLPGPKTPATRHRAVKWAAGGYDAAIAKAPCGRARWPSVIDASARGSRNG